MRKRFYVLLAIIALGLLVALGLWYCHSYYGSYGKDDACVSKTADTYAKNVAQFEADLQNRVQDRDFLQKQGKSEVLNLAPAPVDIPPVDISLLLSLLSLENILRSLECTALPMPLDNNSGAGTIIRSYPQPTPSNPLPPPCEGKLIVYDPSLLPKPKSDAVISFSQSIGRLEIKNINNDPKSGEPRKVAPVMLGTGFVIANGTVAVSCHVLAPLLKRYPQLQLPDPERLVIDFEITRNSLDPNKEFVITHFMGCSTKDGLDVALLDLCDTYDSHQCKTPSSLAPPPALPLLSDGDIDKIKTELSVVVGYPDFDHFIDPVKRAIYDQWIKDVYGKFVLIDGVEAEDDCDRDLGILLDTVSTTVGESGAVAIDLHEPAVGKRAEMALDENGRWKVIDVTNPVVVGMHTCCSAYFEKDYGKPPESDLPCARLRRTFHNQDISTRSILKDKTLCPILKKRDVQVVNMKGEPDPVTCHWWW